MASLSDMAAQRYHVLKEMADCYTELGQYPQAGKTYKQAIEFRPDLHDAWLGLGLLAVQANQLAVAKDALHRVLEIKDDCPQACAALAVTYQKDQDYNAAFDMYLRALELDPDNMLALLGLFQTSAKLGSFAKIIYYLELYLDTHEDDASVLFCLATLYGKEGRYEKARDLLRRVVKIQPDKQEARQLLAKVESMLQPAGVSS
jgi:tetratricopeptide (TPR) repeat protein